jgi:hypothetical protein
MPMISLVPDIRTGCFEWFSSEEAPARHILIYRDLILVLKCVR